MTRDVTYTVTVTAAVLPEGIADGQTLLMQIQDTSTPPNIIATANVPSPTLTYTFTGIDNGSYVAYVCALDSNGNPLGTPITQAFTVADLLFNQPVGPLAITVT
jgi:hypothetical protein